MSLPVADIVTVAVSVSPAAPQAKGFGTELILGTSAILPLYARVRTYTALVGGVDADFASNTLEYKAAAAVFSRNPAPSQVKIGRWFTAAQSGQLRGGTVSSLLSDYTGITNGGFDISINGTNRQIFALNLSGAADLPAVATLIQTKLAAAVAGTTCTWDATNKRFVIVVAASTGTGSTIGYAVAPTGGSSPTDQSTFLGLTSGAGGLAMAGIALETMSAALSASAAFDPNFYGLEVTSVVVQDRKDAAAWAQAAKVIFFNTISDANAEDAAATSDLAYFFKGLGYDHVVTFFDNVNSDLFLSSSAMACMFAVDYTQPNSFITLKFKQAVGYAPVPITETQRLALEGKNCNYYADFGGFSMFANGVVANGRFIDEVIGLDWLQAQVQNAVFTAMATTPTKIPQTNAGALVLTQAISGALSAARTAGLLAPGYWTGPAVGEIKTGDFLENGYYVFASPVATQSASDRSARKAPAITAIGIGAGAIQSAAIGFTFQR